MSPSIISTWTKIPQPDGSILLRPGKPMVQEEEIGTKEAAQILGISQRHVCSLCDTGVLAQGRDWRKNPGPSPNTMYHIKREAALRLRYGNIPANAVRIDGVARANN